MAVVGRPNVGKSTLVNRIIGRREAVVEDVPGRDPRPGHLRRQLARAAGSPWSTPAAGTPTPPAWALRIAEQAQVAVELADVILFVVDATVGVDRRRRGRRLDAAPSGKPVILAANKVDNQQLELEAAALWSLGLGEPQPVSALHGRSSGDLLDVILDALPRDAAAAVRRRARPAPGGAASASPTSASPRCSTSWRARSGCSSTRWRAPPATRSTS